MFCLITEINHPDAIRDADLTDATNCHEIVNNSRSDVVVPENNCWNLLVA